MKLRTVAVFGIGYVLGSRAGKERYAQIVELAKRTGARIEAYGATGGPNGSSSSGAGGSGGSGGAAR